MTDWTPSPCSQCDLRMLCISRGFNAEEQRSLGRLMRQTRSMPHGSALFWQGDLFGAMYAVRQGAVKTVARDADGHERVRGFFLPGDVIGMDALHQGHYAATAETLGETSFCVLPRMAIDKLLQEMPAFATRMLSLMSRDLAHSLDLAGEYTADERLAAFLLDLAGRMRQRSADYQLISLEMSRADIANYLRLVPETVSRVLGRLSKQGLIEVHRRQLKILDPLGLARCAGPLAEAQFAEPAGAGEAVGRAA